MGIREIRYNDISGSEDDIAPHQLHLDQLRINIDLTDAECRHQPARNTDRSENGHRPTTLRPYRSVNH